jgi:hypothetical protein
VSGRARGANTAPIDDPVTIVSCTIERRLAEKFIFGFVAVWVWHAFHTTWPVTAFLIFLELLLARHSIAVDDKVEHPADVLPPLRTAGQVPDAVDNQHVRAAAEREAEADGRLERGGLGGRLVLDFTK